MFSLLFWSDVALSNVSGWFCFFESIAIATAFKCINLGIFISLDYVISGTGEVTQRSQSDATDKTALTSSSVEPRSANTEYDASAVVMSTTEQVSTTDQNGTFKASDNIPGVDPSQGSDEDKMTVDNTEEEARDGVESNDYALVRKATFFGGEGFSFQGNWLAASVGK